jgi:site-specific DNA-methyltransferase (adenine-specific)
MAKEYHQDNLSIFNEDCMKIMGNYPDDYFDLAIVDPPYGMDRKMDGTGGAGRVMSKWKRSETWDIAPSKEYFQELFRVSKNQIIWGANNFWENLHSTTNFIFWYKHQPADNFADGELAWTSFKKTAKCFDHACFGAHGQDPNGKIHPTQKPIKLYNWIYANYAEEGQKIIDTHLGSGSNAISAHYSKMEEFVGCELDEDYFNASIERVHKETRQLELF